MPTTTVPTTKPEGRYSGLKPGYYIECAEYIVGPMRTRESAARKLDEIEAAGHCRERHEVVEVVK